MSSLRILMYHKVSENRQDFLTVSTTQLKEQLTWLKQKYVCITLRALVEHVESAKPLPDNALLITFDDGYENNYTLAYPLFKKLDIPFSIFLISSFIGKKINYDNALQKFLSFEHLHYMQDLVQYGYHSFNHRNLMDLPENQWEQEINKGKETLKAFPVTIENAWAYTYGSFPKKNKAQFDILSSIFQSNAISCAFRIGNRINKTPLSNPYALQRIDVRGNESFLKFKLKTMTGKIF